ncbi:MAG: amidophosphoribosyltransferase [Bdellovibrionales bacterium]|nr:amidophosphoribosyltransferase [Bdellovibrionales bacterium]
MRTWREECAVMGVWGDPEASRMVYLGLYAQQHRGQESAGIVSLSEGKHIHHKGLGHVGEVFQEDDLERLSGFAAIGHNRYSTTGVNQLTNAQPLTAQLFNGPVAIAHNGNIVNAHFVREQLKAEGAIFQGTNDTEVLLHLVARNPSNDLIACLKHAAQRLEGAYSTVVLNKDRMVAMRDPRGFRPLVLGIRKLDGGSESYVIASETCAFDLIGARYVREIEPGEVFWVDQDGEHSERFADLPEKTACCVFEHVYFSRPDSVVFGTSVYENRKNMGRILAKEHPIEADIVMPVPDSGVPAALGYSEESGIPFELGIIRNHYIGRTFIQPSQSIRSFGVKIKHNPQRRVLEGKRVVVVDDSLVRGTTSQKLIGLIRQAGAKEVHFRIASPPTTGACYYGVDTPKRSKLIAATHSTDEIRQFVNADTLSYLSREGLMQAVGGERTGYCAACFDGNYPTDLFGLD